MKPGMPSPEEDTLSVLSSDPDANAPSPEELKNASPDALATAISAFLDAKKAENILVLDVEAQTSLCSRFVIATGRSNTHVNALGDEVRFQTSRRGYAPLATEGRSGGTWLLLDYGPVIVHIFTEEAREFYHLERLYC